jgi:hypothetical protein
MNLKKGNVQINNDPVHCSNETETDIHVPTSEWDLPKHKYIVFEMPCYDQIESDAVHCSNETKTRILTFKWKPPIQLILILRIIVKKYKNLKKFRLKNFNDIIEPLKFTKIEEINMHSSKGNLDERCILNASNEPMCQYDSTFLNI